MSTATHEVDLVEAFRTVAVNGSYSASRAMSKWLRRGVRLTSDGFHPVPICDAAETIGDPENVIAAIHLPLAGDVTGHMLLTFPVEVARALSDLVMQVPAGTTKELGEIEISCLEETGNIVCSAYANSLAKWLNLHIEPAAPTFACDMVCSVVSPLLTEIAAFHDEVYIAKTEFLLEEQSLEWGLMLLPSQDSLERMQQRCRLDSVREQSMKTIAINGAFTASRAVSKWLKRGVKISTEGFIRQPLGQMSDSFDETEPIVALHLTLGVPLSGHAMLTIPKTSAMRLLDLLLDRPLGSTNEIGELEQSALEETGNIVASSFVNSWSTWLDVSVEPSVPQYVSDLPGAVLDAVLADQALTSDEVFMTNTHFIVDGRQVEWTFMLIPSDSAMRLIESSCQ